MLISNLLTYFPEEIYQILMNYFKDDTEEKIKTLEEIRLRTEKPLILKFNKEEIIFKINISQEMILQIYGEWLQMMYIQYFITIL